MVVETKYLVLGTNTYGCGNKIYGSGNKFIVKNKYKECDEQISTCKKYSYILKRQVIAYATISYMIKIHQ
jgi:hypothetical protein